MASIEVWCEGTRMALHHVDSTCIRIGRDERSTLPLPADPLVSREHCLIRRTGPTTYELVDHSTNGTLLNGQPLQGHEPHPLVHGDKIRIGPYELVFRVHVPRRRQAPTSSSIPLNEPCAPAGLGELVGRSVAMQQVFRDIEKTAPHRWTVLVRGETGTGKELVARALHDHSNVPDGPFVAVNAAGLQESLFESELFGHEKGAFTGADERRDGAFHRAAGGTLFLDEIGDLKLELQARLLRVLESGEVRRVGSTDVEHPDTRVVVATHQDLDAMCEAGTFRRDLLTRISALKLTLPPLRERPEDVPDLVMALLERDHPGATITPDAVSALAAHVWPGNVRELRNVLLGAVVRSEGAVERSHLQLDPSDLPDHSDARMDTAVRHYQRTKSAHRVATIMGVSPRTARRWLARAGITLTGSKKAGSG